jgi:hypothetical protein
MFVCCVLSGKGLHDELITRPRGVIPTVACNQETSCDEVAKTEQAEPPGNASHKNQRSSLGQNKITSCR